MGFLQPWLLLALPLALIPIAIHFVNQWRYQTKPWAAMMFLMRAKTMHRGMNRIRQWIILLLRVAVVSGLILAASRPIASGIVGWLSGGNIDMIMVLMDCSPSMLAAGTTPGSTKQETALKQLQQSLSLFQSSKWILLDSNSMEPAEFDSAFKMLASPQLQIGDAACNWPLLLERAISYLERERPTQAQVWIVSDLQQSNFNVTSQRWQAIRDRLSTLQASTRLVSLEYPEPPKSNYAIRITEASLKDSAIGLSSLEGAEVEISAATKTKTDLVLSFVVEDLSLGGITQSNVNRSIPVTIDWQDVKTVLNVEIVAGSGEVKDHRLNTGLVRNVEKPTQGINPVLNRTEVRGNGSQDQNETYQTWGRVQIPQDGNLADNEDFFAAGQSPILKSLVVTENESNLLPLILAARSPADPTKVSQVEVIAPESFTRANLSDVAFLAWQANLPSDSVSEDIDDFLKRGGSLWMFPPEQIVTPDQTTREIDLTSLAVPLKNKSESPKIEWIGWTDLVGASSPSVWKTDDGIFRSTQSGATLDVASIQIKKLAELAGKVRSLASSADGQSLISVVERAGGEATFWKTFPAPGFSNLGSNTLGSNDLGSGKSNDEINAASRKADIVFYIAVQRAMESGMSGLSKTISLNATAGKSNAFNDATGLSTDNGLPPSDQWEPILTTNRFFSGPVSKNAGVFKADGKTITVHRPAEEDESKTLIEADWNRLFGQVPIKRWSEETGSSNSLQSEAWRGLIFLMIVALIVEAAMSLPKKKTKLQSNL